MPDAYPSIPVIGLRKFLASGHQDRVPDCDRKTLRRTGPLPAGKPFLDERDKIAETAACPELFGTDEDGEFRTMPEEHGRQGDRTLTELGEELVPVQGAGRDRKFLQEPLPLLLDPHRAVGDPAQGAAIR